MSKLKQLYQFILGTITVIALTANTILCFMPIFVIGLLKLMPNQTIKQHCSKWLVAISHFWIDFNNLFVKYTRKIDWHLKGNLNLPSNQWYLIISNHQSWLDIVVLQKVLHKKVPCFKFFVKDQLKWVPLLGFAWWAMDMVFMKRFSKDYLSKNPHKKGQDILATKKACEKFNHMPVSIMNFIEGTRLTIQKHKKQNSPYRYLLKPKAGGVAYVLQSMGEKIHSIIDVTITYPEKSRTLWDYLCGRVKDVNVNIRQIAIPEQFLNMDYFNDPEIKQNFQKWLNEKWFEKDIICELQSKLLLGKPAS